jgi:hypothetical protein
VQTAKGNLAAAQESPSAEHHSDVLHSLSSPLRAWKSARVETETETETKTQAEAETEPPPRKRTDSAQT